MELLEGIKSRRSIRRFKEEKVERCKIEQAVEAASYAPSWKNTQTTHYIVILDAGLKNQIAEECVMDFAWNQKTIDGAPVLVVVTTQEGRCGYEKDGSFSTSKGTHWQSFDAGIATQTFCLAAHELGLGTVIMGIYDEAKVKAAVGVPKGQAVSALVAIGYPAQDPEVPNRKKVDDLVTFVE
ncbi:MAG: nitroreductase family protein [Hespellia sp.]|nr:nitroreductase family protein [Hespellia sp.]